MIHKILFVIISLGIIPNAIAQSLIGKATNDYISFYQQVLSNQKNSRCGDCKLNCVSKEKYY